MVAEAPLPDCGWSKQILYTEASLLSLLQAEC